MYKNITNNKDMSINMSSLPGPGPGLINESCDSNNLENNNKKEGIKNSRPAVKSLPTRSKVSSTIPRVSTKVKTNNTERKKVISLSHSKIDDINLKVDNDIDFLFDISLQTNNSKKNENSCKHEETINENGIDVCLSCGIALYDKINNEAEWRYYGDNDNQHSSDPSRCQYRKGQERGIQTELAQLGFSQQIIEISDKLYNKATKGEIKRSNLRKGIMLASVFQAYMNINNPQTTEKLQEIFGIDRKVVTGGINYFRKKVPKEDIKISYITAEHFIPEILDTFNINKEHTDNILELYKEIEKKGTLIDRRNPQSVSKGLVYYYLKKLNVDVTPAKFGKLTKLSESTLNNIISEIDNILYGRF
jgi:transcription initiation factor TFIIIB Brf1 subunit/transcription initiation factor TFIIB